MKEQPLFSIILPVYNCGQYIEKCLSSILSQSERNFECIIVDDGSYDDSVQLVTAAVDRDHRVKLLTQKHSGQSAARNKAIDAATGRYLVFIDADDFVSAMALNIIAQVIAQDRPDVVLFNTYAYEESTERLYIRKALPERRCINGKKLFKEMAMTGSVHDKWQLLFAPWAAVVNRDYIESNGLLFDESFSHGEDELWLTKALILANKVKISNEAYYYNRINRTGSLSMDKSIRKFESINGVIEELLNFAGNQDEEVREVTEERCRKLTINAMAAYSQARSGNSGREIKKKLKRSTDLLIRGNGKYKALGLFARIFGVNTAAWLCSKYIFMKRNI